MPCFKAQSKYGHIRIIQCLASKHKVDMVISDIGCSLEVRNSFYKLQDQGIKLNSCGYWGCNYCIYIKSSAINYFRYPYSQLSTNDKD